MATYSFMRIVILSTALVCCAQILSAQQFWIEPSSYYAKPGDSISVRFVVGENLNGDAWNLRKERIQKLELFYGNTVQDLLPMVKEGQANHLKFRVGEPGAYVLKIKTKNSFIELPATNFNAYLKENAMDDAILRRQKTDATTKPGKEFYTRNAKAIIQVGDKEDGGYKKNTALPLEIIPLTNTKDFKEGDAVKFKVMYHGKPLFGARAFVWNNQGVKTYAQPIYSQQDGTIEVRIFNNGLWMISVIQMTPATQAGADWQSYWGTLVFEVK